MRGLSQSWLVICCLAAIAVLALSPAYTVAAARHQEDELRARADALAEGGKAAVEAGQLESALEKYEEAFTLYNTLGDRARELGCLLTIGVVRRQLADYTGALDAFEATLPMWRDIDYPVGEGMSLNNMGYIFQCLGQLDDALAHYKQALEIHQRHGNRRLEATSLRAIGTVYTDLGQYAEALEYCQRALAIYREIEDQSGEANTLNSIGLVYDELGQYERALDHYQKALAEAQNNGDRHAEAVGLGNVGTLYGTLGQYEEALIQHEQALAIWQGIGVVEGEMTTLANIGTVFFHLGQYEEAEDYFLQAIAISQSSGDRISEAIQLNNLGAVYKDLDLHEQALDHYEKGLAICQEIGALEGQARILGNIAAVFAEQGDAQMALAYYRQSIEVFESMLGDVHIEELAASLTSVWMDLYEAVISFLREQGLAAEGFSYAERARARAFLYQIGNQQIDFRETASPELSAEEQALRLQILGLQTALSELRAKPFEQQSPDLRGQLTRELEEARANHADLLTRLKLESPEYASLVSVSTLSLEQVQDQVLDQDTTLIEYFILDDQVLAWVIDQQGFEWVALEIGRDDLQNQVEFLGELIKTLEFAPDVAADLYGTLFSPLKPHIRHANLVIVPHGVLHYLPFAALWDAEDERYLVQDYALTYAPSASVLQYILDKRNADEGRLLALGNPDGSLPYAAAEAEAVAELYDSVPLLGPEATESQVYAQAGQIDLLHLAAHGVYNPCNALYSRIELAPDDAQDGNLETHEVFGLDLTGANLVVLSACQTALGEQSEGDELVGLTRAFLYAGTPAVVTTLWSIDDAASGALMEAFYRHLREGLTNAEALRVAQVAVMGQEAWAEPYYWAAFSLTGDYWGSGEPGMALADTPEPTQAALGVGTPTSVPAVEPSPAAGGGTHGLCAGAALPLGLVLLVGIQHRRMRRRNGP